MSVEKLSVESF